MTQVLIIMEKYNSTRFIYTTQVPEEEKYTSTRFINRTQVLDRAICLKRGEIYELKIY